MRDSKNGRGCQNSDEKVHKKRTPNEGSHVSLGELVDELDEVQAGCLLHLQNIPHDVSGHVVERRCVCQH